MDHQRRLGKSPLMDVSSRGKSFGFEIGGGEDAHGFLTRDEKTTAAFFKVAVGCLICFRGVEQVLSDNCC